MNTMTIIKSISAALCLNMAVANAASIGVNFSENNGNQNWLADSTPIGPLGIPSVNFNSNNSPNANGPANIVTGSLSAGTVGNLVNNLGDAVAMTVSWSAANPYYNSSGTLTNEARLAVGYLDDGGSGALITAENVPYPIYNVYVLLGSDSGDEHTSEVPLVNGTPVLSADFPAYGNLNGSGGGWIEADGTTRGNYVVARNITGSSFTIAGQNNTANRIGIAGFVVQQVPEPSSALLGLVGSLALLRRRRA